MACAAHPRRQKHREMPPPGASAPAFAATVEPARARPHAKHPRQDACFGARWNACRGMCCFLHRFLISGPDLGIDVKKPSRTAQRLHRFLISSPDLRIDACFSPFTPSCVHRFLISSPNLGIDASFSTITPSFVHRFMISGSNLGIDVKKPSRTAQRLHRFLISSPNLGIDAAQSSWRWRTARLQDEHCGRRRGLDVTKAA